MALGGDKTGKDDWYEKNVPMLGGKFSFHVEFDNFNCELQMPQQMAMA